jgi:hypothetical protein
VTVTTECEIEVQIAALLNAVKAALPHAEKPRLGEDVSPLARVRLVAARDELLVAATNGRTSALAAVAILDDSRVERFAADDGVFSVDLHPKMLRGIAAGLTAAKDDGEPVGEARMTFTGPGSDGTPGKVTALDVGGLWIGSETTRPLLPLAEGFPDVVGLLSRALGAAEGSYKPLVTEGPDLAAFTAAARAYGQPLQVEPVGQPGQRGWIVLCGPDFAGSLTGGHGDDDSLRRRDTWRHRHLERLGLGAALKSVG